MLQVIFIDTDKYQFGTQFRLLATNILESANEAVRQYLPALDQHLTFAIQSSTDVILKPEKRPAPKTQIS